MVQEVTNEKEYRGLIEGSIDRVRLKGIATKILQHMARIRNVSDQSQARRWVMELLQNAQDVAYEGQPVRVKVRLTDDKLTFSHNGKPFRVQDILSIINQVSSKDPNGDNVGKFGTGFVTTFQLSEKVQVDSVLHEEGYPVKDFSVTLDRTGNEEDEILAAIVTAMQSLGEVDREPEKADFDPNAYNTSFIYHLTGEENKRAALTGMEDLQHSVYYILLFSGKLREITLEYRTADRQETVCYRRVRDCIWEEKTPGEATQEGLQEAAQERVQEGSQEEWQEGVQEGAQEAAQETDREEARTGLRRLEFATVRRREGEAEAEETSSSLIYLRENGLTLAAGWQEECGFLPISEYTPRLFVNFPLIGAEQFPFPVVIDCREFRVNEPRSGISLVDNPASKDAPINKEIMQRAVGAYHKFLEQAVRMERKGLENVLWIPAWRENREASEEWVRSYIYEAVYRGIADVLTFETNRGKGSLGRSGICLIREKDETVRGKLKEMLFAVPGLAVPTGGEDWYGALENYPVEEEKIWSLEKLLDRCESLLPSMRAEAEEDPEGGQALSWLANLCRLGLSRPETAVKIRTGQIRILPGQADWNSNKLHGVESLKKDPMIPEVLKDVSEELDKLNSPDGEEPLEIRKKLLRREFSFLDIPELATYEVTKLESYIARRSHREYRVSNFNAYRNIYLTAWKKAWLKLLACGPDREMHRLCEVFYGEELPAYEPCEGDWKDSMWKPCYVSVLNQMTEWVAEAGTLAGFAGWNFPGETQAVEWLNELIAKGQEYLNDFAYKSVFPDQEGKFRAFQWIKEDGTPDDVLKEIALVFRREAPDCNFYDRVLDRRIRVGKLAAGKLAEEEVALVLNRTLQQILATRLLADTPMEYQVACSRLLTWMEEHAEQTARFFPAFASEQEKVRLMTPQAVVELQKECRQMEDVMREFGVGNLEELKGFVSAMSEQLKSLQESGSQEKQGWYLSDDWDVVFGGELLEYDDAERSDILRMIGTGGEKYALQKVKEYCMERGAKPVSEKECEAVLQMPGDAGETVITYGDSGNYHQAGWDIRVETGGETYYIEVKTHTLNSEVFHQITLSESQMKMACREKEHYIVLHVAYDRAKGQGVECRPFRNPVERYGAGELKSVSNRYTFYF